MKPQIKTKNEICRENYFRDRVHIKEIVEQIIGKDEKPFLDILSSLGFVKDVDFVIQHPLYERYVVDVAFLNEKVVVEIDGEKHKEKRNKVKDEIRDSFLHENGWIVIRCDSTQKDTYKLVYYKNLIKDIVEERRKLFNDGEVFE